MKRVQFDVKTPAVLGTPPSGRYRSSGYQPTWISSHKGEQVSSEYDSMHNKMPQYQQHELIDGWQLNLSDNYLENYPLMYDRGQPYLQTQPQANENPRTSVFEHDQPVVLTSHDEIPIQKYTSHVIEEDDDSSSQPNFSNFEELQHEGNLQETVNYLNYGSPRTQSPQYGRGKADTEPTPITYFRSTIDAPSLEPKSSHVNPIRSSKRSRDRRLCESLTQLSTSRSFQSERSNEISTSVEDILTTGPRWRRVQDNPIVIPYDDLEAYEKEFFIFYTKFKDPTFPHNLPRGIRWYNIPKKWESLHHGGLRVFSKSGSDFWQQTYFGKDENKDSGHFLYLPCTHSKILVETSLTLTPREQNDQAGVMVRYDRRNWVRAGIEFIDGSYQLTCVCTINGFSDWSIQEHKGGRKIEFRMYVINGDIIIEHRSPHSENSHSWKVLRLAHIDTNRILPKASQPEYARDEIKQKIHSMVGLYTCRPSTTNSDALSYVTFNFMSVRHCEQYERKEEEETPQISDDTYGNFRKIAGPYIADGDYFIDPEKPVIKTFEMY